MRVLVIVGTDKDTQSIADQVMALYPYAGISGVWADTDHPIHAHEVTDTVRTALTEFIRKMEAIKE